jgi:hypothetical protein
MYNSPMAVPTNKTQEFLFLMRGAQWGGGLSPQEAQNGLDAMMNWVEDLRQQGHLTAGQPLSFEGILVSADRQGTLMDGPFVETKEAVGGYLIVRAESLEQARAFAAQCPVLKYGLFIEVRPIIPQCSIASELTGELLYPQV